MSDNPVFPAMEEGLLISGLNWGDFMICNALMTVAIEFTIYLVR